jgi:hypothetical protein
MSRVLAGITISVDGFITGPGDGPGCGLGPAVSACTTGCSVGPGAMTRPGAGSRPVRTRPGWRRQWAPTVR